ncbi:hypothetical protein Leryth_022963 [Lithospermum erythrorhizon]|nr:hypothetical protein Leryth_022963 [Lithospermum erythrorhizon]
MVASILRNVLCVSPFFAFNTEHIPQARIKIRCLASKDTNVVSANFQGLNGVSSVSGKEIVSPEFGSGNGHSGSVGRGKTEEGVEEKLEVLWDDGYGTESVKDYLDLASDIIKPDGGPPRWFTPLSCGSPLKDSPLLFFLPGMDGLGMGLILHHKALGKVFRVWCMHIPVYDRTPFEELVQFAERTIRAEHELCPEKPIYLVGDSFGGCLALAVAARNPSIDLVAILANPATSFDRSQLQPFFPLLELMPDQLHATVPYLLSSIMGDPVKMAMVNIDSTNPSGAVLEQLSNNLTGLLPRLSVMADIIPRESLLWKLKQLKSAASYANARLHAVTAEVLVIASGNDNMLPSGDEAKRLLKSIKNCKVRIFKDNGHTILLEDGVNLLTIMKSTCTYRRSRRRDYVKDYLPPSKSEFKQVIDGNTFYRNFVGPVIFSTLADGTIVRGLTGVPDEGPVLLVGYHMLMGLELGPLLEAFLQEKKIMVRGIAHPSLFSEAADRGPGDVSFFDTVRLYGGLPVSASNFFKLFAEKSHVLLYPGGAREALHFKGEAYKLFWPDQPEFVRMAAKFGATIVPFGAVGEDDILEVIEFYITHSWNNKIFKILLFAMI